MEQGIGGMQRPSPKPGNSGSPKRLDSEEELTLRRGAGVLMATIRRGEEGFLLLELIGERCPALRSVEERRAYLRDHRGAHRLQAFFGVLPVLCCGRHCVVRMSFDIAPNA